MGGVVYLGTGSGFAAQTNFAPGILAADFVGDNDGDGLTDFASNQAIKPGTPTGIDGGHTLFIQAGEFVFASAGDIDGDGYGDTVSSLSSNEGFPERNRPTSVRRRRAARTAPSVSRPCSSPVTISR